MLFRSAWATACATNGETVVSGGAYGVDAAAHRGALAAGGPTVVCMGTAIDRVYPAAHRALFTTILERGGVLLSEFPPGANIGAWGHARRNRLIAALSERLLLAEAAKGSDSLQTAQWAARFQRRVLVPVPEVGGVREGLEKCSYDEVLPLPS